MRLFLTLCALACVPLLQGCGDPSCVDTATCEPPRNTMGGGGTAGSGAAGNPSAGGNPATGGAGGTDLKAQGDLCAAPTECTSGNCVDGVCCESACDTLCERCDTGTCEATPTGDDPDDECGPTSSCNGARQCGGQHIWSKSFGSATDDTVVAVAVDGQDNIVIAGNFDGTINFGGPNLTSVGTYLAKFDRDGNHLWSKQFVRARVRDMSVDGTGSVLMTGGTVGIVNFGGLNFLNSGMFMARFNAAGSHSWSNVFPGSARGWAIRRAPNFDMVVAGTFFDDTFDLGGGPLPHLAQNFHTHFMARFTAGGQHLP